MTSPQNSNRLVFVDKYGWPVERIANHRIINLIRLLLHTRKIVRYGMWRKNGGCEIAFK